MEFLLGDLGISTRKVIGNKLRLVVISSRADARCCGLPIIVSPRRLVALMRPFVVGMFMGEPLVVSSSYLVGVSSCRENILFLTNPPKIPFTSLIIYADDKSCAFRGTG